MNILQSFLVHWNTLKGQKAHFKGRPMRQCGCPEVCAGSNFFLEVGPCKINPKRVPCHPMQTFQKPRQPPPKQHISRHLSVHDSCEAQHARKAWQHGLCLDHHVPLIPQVSNHLHERLASSDSSEIDTVFLLWGSRPSLEARNYP